MQTRVLRQQIRHIASVGVLAAMIFSAGCGGDDNGKPTAAATAAKVNHVPTIEAAPVTSVSAGSAYTLTPVTADVDGDVLAFSVENRPAWAGFNTVTGELSGTPRAEDLGTYADVIVSVSDGKARATLPAFSITVAAAGAPGPDDPGPREDHPPPAKTATLQWSAPTQDTDGNPVHGLRGYRIYYGHNSHTLSHCIDLPGVGNTTYVVDNLKPGTYYFAVAAVDASGQSSGMSNLIKRVII